MTNLFNGLGFRSLFKAKPSQTSIDPELEKSYLIGKKMGAGNFATVFLVKERKTGKDYAAKVISRKRVEGKEHLVLNELRILTMAQHPNIVFFCGIGGNNREYQRHYGAGYWRGLV